MRHFIFISLLILSQVTFAQVKGNKNIINRSFSIEAVKEIVINLYADVLIDCSMEAGIQIIADENLMDLIDRDITDGKLSLDQKEWIQPSQRIKITIGAPALQALEQGTHETTRVKNIEQEKFRAMALVGKIVLEGESATLNASCEVGEVDARKLSHEDLFVNIWGWGTVYVNDPKVIQGIVEKGGTLYYEGGSPEVKVRTNKDGTVKNRLAIDAEPKIATRFIDLKIKNNSLNRINAYVVGPKPDGKKFSYGFPLNPGQTRKKHWTIGSKVYRVSNIGTRKLLLEITEADEGQIVKLYN